MADFPELTADIHGLSEASLTKTVKTVSEANYVQTRARATRARKSFNVIHPFMLLSEYQTLRTFFETTVRGASTIFNWTNINDSVTYEVRYKEDTLACTYYCPSWVRNVSFVLEEA